MSGIGKTTKSIRKKAIAGDHLTIPKTILFAHKFASDSSSLDLSNLIVPNDAEFASWINPTSTEISQARISSKKAKVYLQYTNSAARLIPTLSYDIASDTAINFKNGAEASAGDIIIGWIDTYAGSAKAVDAYSIVKTGVLTTGQTDIIVNLPFTYNKYSGEQVGDVIFFLGGQQLFRCVNNINTNNGEYTEIAPSAGNLTNTLRLKTPVGSDTSYLIVSNGLVAFAPTESWLSYVQTLGAQMDIVIADLAATTGNATSRYQAAPNEVDLGIFGQKVNSIYSETFYNAVVGSAAQVTASKATHSTIQSAIDSVPTKGRILVLDGTFTETVTINKTVTIEGKGQASVINGTTTFTADYCLVKGLRFADNITFNAGADGNFVRECWIASGKSVTDNGSVNQNLIIEEA